jgi:hypothetical protein
MPSRKQRRRRQKELRHDYEYVYVDAEGHEVEVDEPDPEPKRRRGNGTPKADEKKAKSRSAGARRRRPVQPPSWTRSGKRALIFFPLFLLVFSLVSRNSSYAGRFITALLYTLLFIPLTYVIDRTAYRTYLRRGGTPAATERKPKPAARRR